VFDVGRCPALIGIWGTSRLIENNRGPGRLLAVTVAFDFQGSVGNGRIIGPGGRPETLGPLGEVGPNHSQGGAGGPDPRFGVLELGNLGTEKKKKKKPPPWGFLGLVKKKGGGAEGGGGPPF